MAAELLKAEDAAASIPTKESDFWSFGMTVLEVSLLGSVHWNSTKSLRGCDWQKTVRSYQARHTRHPAHCRGRTSFAARSSFAISRLMARYVQSLGYSSSCKPVYCVRTVASEAVTLSRTDGREIQRCECFSMGYSSERFGGSDCYACTNSPTCKRRPKVIFLRCGGLFRPCGLSCRVSDVLIPFSLLKGISTKKGGHLTVVMLVCPCSLYRDTYI